LTVISLSIPDALLEQVDSTINERGFASRSEITRQALRFFLKEDAQIENVEGEIVATATIIYKEHANRQRLLDAQHVYSGLVSTFLHAHIHEGYCLEVIILKGQAKTIRKFTNTLRTNEQITKLNITILAQL
jgi:CopG family nickel-responsive transcriptional regulator